jgi:hypothetical protein
MGCSIKPDWVDKKWKWMSKKTIQVCLTRTTFLSSGNELLWVPFVGQLVCLSVEKFELLYLLNRWSRKLKFKNNQKYTTIFGELE